VLHGTEDPLFGLAYGEAFAKAIPQAKLHVIENMGHNLNAAAYSQVIQLIGDLC